VNTCFILVNICSRLLNIFVPLSEYLFPINENLFSLSEYLFHLIFIPRTLQWRTTYSCSIQWRWRQVSRSMTLLRLVVPRTWKGHGMANMPIDTLQHKPEKPALCSRSLQENDPDSASTEQRYLLSPRVPCPLAPS
jgi:hypothetical protein